MTHADLVQRAVKWLRYALRCGVVLAEHNAGHEFPDAIGWRGSWSHVVECKISRADFFADRKKPTRASYGERPACWCYYMTPPRLVAPEELPDGWGLVEVADATRAQVRRVVRPKPDDQIDDRTEHQMRREVVRLYQEVRRYQAQGLRYQTVEAFRKSAIRFDPVTAPPSASPSQEGS